VEDELESGKFSLRPALVEGNYLHDRVHKWFNVLFMHYKTNGNPVVSCFTPQEIQECQEIGRRNC
jgi:hypothetical protein